MPKWFYANGEIGTSELDTMAPFRASMDVLLLPNTSKLEQPDIIKAIQVPVTGDPVISLDRILLAFETLESRDSFVRELQASGARVETDQTNEIEFAERLAIIT